MLVHILKTTEVVYRPGGYDDYKSTVFEGDQDLDPAFAAYIELHYPGIIGEPEVEEVDEEETEDESTEEDSDEKVDGEETPKKKGISKIFKSKNS